MRHGTALSLMWITSECFRVFGSDAYAHIPKDERSKFDVLWLVMELIQTVRFGREKDNSKSRCEIWRMYKTQLNWIHGRWLPFDRRVFKWLSEQESQDTQSEEMQPEPSVTLRRHPDFYAREHTSFCEALPQPTSYREATNGATWQKAMETSLKDNDVWDLVKCPILWNVQLEENLYKVKTKADG